MLKSAGLIIGFYQKSFSPDHGRLGFFFGYSRCRQVRLGCRFFPSCSEYARRSLRQYGLIKGFVASLKRMARCHPWNEGGYDPVEGYEMRKHTNI